jgi:RNA polymerase sigma-70 factor (ECF subfamily)
MIQDEEILLEALKRRDSFALAELFERYSDPIYRLALRLLNDETGADGVVQDTFMTLIEHIDTFEGRANIGTWLYRVAYNNALGRLRKRKPVLELDSLEEAELPLPAVLLEWDSIPEALITGSEAKTEIDRAIDSLKPTLRAVFVLRDIEELSINETAQVLGISPAAVKVRLHRARLALREALSSYFQERLETR